MSNSQREGREGRGMGEKSLGLDWGLGLDGNLSYHSKSKMPDLVYLIASLMDLGIPSTRRSENNSKCTP